jgi:hypothetical protein
MNTDLLNDWRENTPEVRNAMKKVNKYLYLHVVQGYYTPECGWEDLCQSDVRRVAHDDLVAYRKNCPEYPHRMIYRREPNPDWESGAKTRQEDK